MNTNVLWAIFKRNFVAYFSTPTGYVFICVFVLMSSSAAFWPDEFFTANLANLDQLNRWLPWIMLVFIPSITMGVWSEERRQGTDELLLTIPAGDLEVVLGKYLAAVAIYTASLAFSLVSNYIVLRTLGDPDVGLFMGTYFGYWLMGVSMLAVGMVASFLTSNLTIAFILGALFNAPLVGLAFLAELELGLGWGPALGQWGINDRFAEFGRGVVSLAGVTYFLAVVVVMLYICMVLIGRRHWVRGRSSQTMAFHFLGRSIALVLIGAGIVFFFGQFRWTRLDVTSERLSSLSPRTRQLIDSLTLEHPVVIDAYISEEVPEQYVQTRLNLKAMLEEFQARGRGKISVQIHDTKPHSNEAEGAKRRFAITGRTVTGEGGEGAESPTIFMGLAFTSGLKQAIVPFIDRGTAIEYELIRSILSVDRPQRKRLGVIAPRVFDPRSRTRTAEDPLESVSLLIEELKQQYEVVTVDPSMPIPVRSDDKEKDGEKKEKKTDDAEGDTPEETEETKYFDVLLAIQPSSLRQGQIDNLVAAVKAGQPTAIFEDPYVSMTRGLLSTTEPWPEDQDGLAQMQQQAMMQSMNPNLPPEARQQMQQRIMMMRQQMVLDRKGDLGPLWKALGVKFGGKVLWQDYNPHPRLNQVGRIPKEWIFVDGDCGVAEPFNQDDPTTAGLQEMVLWYPGNVKAASKAKTQVTTLVLAGDQTGTIDYEQYWVRDERSGHRIGMRPESQQEVKMPEEDTQDPYAVAVSIESDDDASKVRAILTADVDLLCPFSFQIRNGLLCPICKATLTESSFDNVTYVLNVVDALATEEDLLEIRKRRRAHRGLASIRDAIHEAKQEAETARKEAKSEYDKDIEAYTKQIKKEAEKLDAREDLNSWLKGVELGASQMVHQQQLHTKEKQRKQRLDERNEEIETELAVKTQQIQDRYKMWAVVVPPIPPLLVAIIVFFLRRTREYEGVARSRLR